MSLNLIVLSSSEILVNEFERNKELLDNKFTSILTIQNPIEVLNLTEQCENTVLFIDDETNERNKIYRMVDFLDNVNLKARTILYTENEERDFFTYLLTKNVNAIIHKFSISRKIVSEKICDIIDYIHDGRRYLDKYVKFILLFNFEWMSKYKTLNKTDFQKFISDKELIKKNKKERKRFKDLLPNLSYKDENKIIVLENFVCNHLIKSRLTEIELEILYRIGCGEQNKDIGENMFVSPHTIDKHKSNIKNKLGLKSSFELEVFAFLFCLNFK